MTDDKEANTERSLYLAGRITLAVADGAKDEFGRLCVEALGNKETAGTLLATFAMLLADFAEELNGPDWRESFSLSLHGLELKTDPNFPRIDTEENDE